MDMPLLAVRKLKTYFYTSKGAVKAVDGVSFDINNDEVFCLVGETGCGKTVTSLAIMRLIPYPGKIIDGSILYKGKDLLKLHEREMRYIRGKEIAMVFQNPMNSLDPVYTIGYQIAEAPITHFNLSFREGWKKAVELIGKVKMPDPKLRAKTFPHELSGGMRQRSMLAMMISCEPSLLIADEPTTGVDVTIQAQLMNLLKDIKGKRKMSIMLITHNFGLVAETGDRVAVMYCGKIIEIGSVREIFKEPMHPYTQGLMGCLPIGIKRKKQLSSIPGMVPNLINLPQGCRFQTRCKYNIEKCKLQEPVLAKMGRGHLVACHLYEG